jgi:putative hydrolase of the HAD superfamily
VKTPRAIIFDFDGTIIDTETPVFRAWEKVYSDFDIELAKESYATCIGSDFGGFNPFEDLETKTGRKIDWDSVTPQRRSHYRSLLSDERAMDGVAELVEEAKMNGLKLAIASSSPREWIDQYLPQTGLEGKFETIVTLDDVTKAKPDPELFLVALERMGIKSSEAMVIEDSPNGCLAAKQAGLFCVIVRNSLTRFLNFKSADLLYDSLVDTCLEDILRAWRS